MMRSAWNHDSSDDYSVFSPTPPLDGIDGLVNALVSQKAVLFVGAGASIPAGMPSWKQLLEMCLEEMSRSSVDSEHWRLTKRILERGDFLVAAEMLQSAIGDASLLRDLMVKFFGKRAKPTELHQMLARLPFTIALTTNYDHLLQDAYPPTQDGPVSNWTWQAIGAFFNAIRRRSFAIIKTHGDYADPDSIILAKSAYNKQAIENEAFNACVEDLLLYRTFLFVGCSLTDEDILSKLARGKKMYKGSYGPHYAILFSDDVDEKYRRYLDENYAIQVITVTPGKTTVRGLDPKTKAVRDLLLAIRGEVDVKMVKEGRADIPNLLGNSLLSVPRDVGAILKRTVELTSSLRGDVDLIRSTLVQRLFTVARFTTGNDKPEVHSFPINWKRIDPHTARNGPLDKFSVVESLFLQKGRSFVYLSDVNDKASLERQGFRNSMYRICDPRTCSELAAAVVADGDHIGVINIESDVFDGYAKGHLDLLRAGAIQIGLLFSEARRRAIAAQGLAEYCDEPSSAVADIGNGEQSPQLPKTRRKTSATRAPTGPKFSRFIEHLSHSRELVDHEMRFILFKADHFTGRLIGHWDRSHADMCQQEEFFYEFDSDSLAVECARTERILPVKNVEVALAEGKMSPIGVQAFNIKGPCEARPVICGGDVAAVLVIWSKQGRLHETSGYTLFRRMVERTFRIVSVIGNNPSSVIQAEAKACLLPGSLDAASFLKVLHESLFAIDQGVNWPKRKLVVDAVFRMAIIEAALKSLTHPSVGIGRVRFWIRVSDQPQRFQCIRQAFADGYNQPEPMTDELTSTSESDPYCSYTIARWPTDPYAQTQHRSMFPNFVIDPNSGDLRKDPDGEWLVAPVGDDAYVIDDSGDNSVEKQRRMAGPYLSGFISADCHTPSPSGPKAREVSAVESSYHRKALDLVSHVIAPAANVECKERIRAWKDDSRA